MKRLLLMVCFGVFAGAAMAKDAPRSAEQLRSQVETTLKTKDTNGAVALVNWQGVTPAMKANVSRQFSFLASRGVTGVKLAPWPQDRPLINELNGVRYTPNVRVLGLLEVEFGERGDDAEIPYGDKNGAFYIAAVTEELFDPNAKKAIPLNIGVLGLFPKDKPGILSCTYVYVSDGKEITQTFRCTNGLSQSFLGDFVKSCQVTKISGQGSYELRITENTKPVFDSGMVEDRSFINYQQK